MLGLANIIGSTISERSWREQMILRERVEIEVL